ncbi:MAG: phosphatase PAP2 family protein [bacterium]
MAAARASACLILTVAQQALTQSPYEISWKKDGLAAGGGVLLLAVGLGLSAKVAPLTEEEIDALSREDVNAFDRPATYNYSEAANRASEIGVWTCMALPLSFLVSERMRADAGTIALMYAESLLLANGVAQIVKGTLQRTRPFAYNPEAPLASKTDPEARKSFYSSHTSNAFASAVFFATVYGDYFPASKWRPHVWGGSLVAAATVGYLRFEAGMHFPTDVLVGGAVGAIIGRMLPRWHRRSARGLNVTPVYHFGQAQVQAEWKF